MGWVRDTFDPFSYVLSLSVYFSPAFFRHKGRRDMEVNFQHENFPIKSDQEGSVIFFHIFGQMN